MSSKVFAAEQKVLFIHHSFLNTVFTVTRWLEESAETCSLCNASEVWSVLKKVFQAVRGFMIINEGKPKKAKKKESRQRAKGCKLKLEPLILPPSGE